MSKLDFKLSYKDALILKHALQEQCDEKEVMIDEYYCTIEDYKNIPDWELPDDYDEEVKRLYGIKEDIKKDEKELEEEKRCLKRFIEQLEMNKNIKGIE